MDLNELLERGEAAPLGPLTLKVTSDGPGAWWLSVTYGSAAPVSMHLIDDRPAGAVRLERQILSQLPYEKWQAALDSRSWLTEAAPIAGGGVAVRLWLSAVDLQLNTLLTAAADLARLERLATGVQPAPSGASGGPPRTVSWQTLSTPPVAQPSAPAPAAPLEPAPGPPQPTPPADQPAGDESWYCRECGAQRPANHTFCTNCGAQKPG